MRKASMKRRRDELRPEYDLTSLKGAVRGKYYQRCHGGNQPGAPGP
jgi:hypothetical protein